MSLETTSTAESLTKNSISELSGKYLAFSLSEESYGLKILKVQELIGMMHITQVPQCQNYIKGVINLRGKIIPVVDLRLKFNLPETKYDERTCIIVVECMIKGKKTSIGAVVDTVLEVMNFDEKNIEYAPDYGTKLDTNFVIGMGRSPNNDVLILIDIDVALADAKLPHS
ncbi:MAG: purine-binding chemotaxis protein CheW [Proteobacteria bacterium]|nr:purine-binding chemotaxis protein CheW [Pseudomonadota bacterium]